MVDCHRCVHNQTAPGETAMIFGEGLTHRMKNLAHRHCRWAVAAVWDDGATRCTAVSVHLPTAWDTEANSRNAVEDSTHLMQGCARKGHIRPTKTLIAGDFNETVHAGTEKARGMVGRLEHRGAERTRGYQHLHKQEREEARLGLNPH